MSGLEGAGRKVPHRRPASRGSFAAHFDELVAVFPDALVEPDEQTQRSAKLQEKIDIHAVLFRRAWQVDGREP